MLEQIALSITTAIFFICTAIVNSLIPTVPATVSEPAMPCAAESDTLPDGFLIGKWEDGHNRYEFSSDGKLNYNSSTVSYALDGNKLKIRTELGGKPREYTLTVEIIDGRNILLGGVSLRRFES